MRPQRGPSAAAGQAAGAAVAVDGGTEATTGRAALAEGWNESGYLTLRQVTPVAEIERVRALVEELFARRVGREVGDFLDLAGDDREAEAAGLPQLLMPTKYAPELSSGRLREDAERIARRILGDGVVSEGEHVILKPALVGAETPLHQDEAFWSGNLDYQSLSLWFPLQDVTAEGGCMHYVAGSHRLGVLPHHSVDGDPTKNGLEIDQPERFEPIAEPLMRGDVTAHHCRTIHGAGANRTSHPRFAYIFGFGLPAERAAEPRDFYWLREKRTLREERARQHGFELTKMRPEA